MRLTESHVSLLICCFATRRGEAGARDSSLDQLRLRQLRPYPTAAFNGKCTHFAALITVFKDENLYTHLLYGFLRFTKLL